MGDAVQRPSSNRRETYDPDCDESTGVCGAQKPVQLVSRPGDVEYQPPAPKVDAAQNAAIARNMAAANKPKLDELSWRALRAEISSLEASKGDPARLAACKHELERRQGIAAESRPTETVTHWGPNASGELDGKRLVASGKVTLATNSDGSVEIGSVNGAVGGNNEVGAAAVRIKEKTTAAGTTTVEVGSGKVSAGTANSDGSVGFHVAAQGTVVSVEHTEQTKEGASATGGLSIGTGFEVSFGFKGDGICMRVGAGPLTLGGCTTAPGASASWGDDGSKR